MADLGVSSYQLDTPERISYRFDQPLDMRMDTAEGPTAADLLNQLDAAQLQELFSAYGEVRNARTLAQACLQARAAKPFATTGDLTSLCEKHLMGDRFRYLSQVYQALRMEVNDETGALSDFSDRLPRNAGSSRPVGRDYLSFNRRSHRQKFYENGQYKRRSHQRFITAI